MVVEVVVAFGALIVLVGLYLLIKNVAAEGAATFKLPGGPEFSISGPNSLLVLVLGAAMLSAPLWAPSKPVPTPVSKPATEPEAAPAPAPQPAPPPTVTMEADYPLAYDKPHGRIAKSADGWHETDTSTGMDVTFKEVKRDRESTLLYDESRDLYLKVPTDGGTVMWSHSNPMVWTQLYIASPSKG